MLLASACLVHWKSLHTRFERFHTVRLSHLTYALAIFSDTPSFIGGAQRIMASYEHLVSPFSKWKLSGFVVVGEKLFSRTLLVTVIHQQDANGNIRLLLDCFQ
jgi:hypothetical protein